MAPTAPISANQPAGTTPNSVSARIDRWLHMEWGELVETMETLGAFTGDSALVDNQTIAARVVQNRR